MSGMYGADVAQLRQLASQFDQCAQRLDANRMTVGNAIKISAWIGPVAVRFRHQWDSEYSRSVHDAASRLHEAAHKLRANADEQERTSAAEGGAPFTVMSSALTPSGIWKDGIRGESLEDIFDNLIVSGASWVSDRVDFAGMAVEYFAGKEFDPWKVLPNGSYVGSVFKGIGLGDAAARVAQAIQNRDLSGGMLAVADGVFSFAPSPVSYTWSALSDMTSFFIPLDSASQDEHLEWLQSRGYTPSQIADRYTGVQGFIDLGRDNVERKAPWLNRIAEDALRGPGEWLYNHGIRFV